MGPTPGNPVRISSGSRSGPHEPAPGPAYSARVAVRDLLYAVYERRLRRQLAGRPVPRHVGVMCDGNRRWARAAGVGDVSFGHQAGADKIEDVLRWSADAGVEVVTLWLLSTENLSRPESELRPLLADHRGTGRRPGRGPGRLADQAGRRAGPAPAGDRAGAQGRGRADRGRPRAGGQHRRRVRRAAGDRRRGPLAAARARRRRAPRSRSWPRCWTSTTSPSTSTPAASPTPTW